MRKLLAPILIIAAGPVAAQDWNYQATLYGWLPGISSSLATPLGRVNADKGSSDVLEDLDFAFMGTFESRSGRWGVMADLLYADLSANEDTPFGVAYSDADVDLSMTAFSGYAMYRAHEGPNLAFDVGGGFRAFSVDLGIELNSAGRVQDREFDSDETWVVPLVAARVIVPFDEKFFATGVADVGGLSGDNSTWQALATVGYRFNPRWSTQIGYRYMSLGKEIGGRDVDLDLSGPVVAVSVRF